MPDNRWSPEAQRYLDGEAPLAPHAADRAPADRFVAAMRDWAAGLPELDGALDHRVMAAVRDRARTRQRAWWRWFIEPRRVALRPALAAAAAVALVALSSLATALLRNGPAPTADAPATVPGTGTVLVRFELRAPDAQRVTLAGSFNEWSDSTIVFSPSAEPGVWSVTVALPPGRHQYLFVVDGSRWIPDPSAHAQVEDEFGQQNSLLVVGPRGVVRS